MTAALGRKPRFYRLLAVTFSLFRHPPDGGCHLLPPGEGNSGCGFAERNDLAFLLLRGTGHGLDAVPYVPPKRKNAPRLSSGSISLCWHCPIFPVRRQTSIFGTGELNCRVRNGNGWTLTAKSTNCGTPSGTRTLDTLIKSQVLYQLS